MKLHVPLLKQDDMDMELWIQTLKTYNAVLTIHDKQIKLNNSKTTQQLTHKVNRMHETKGKCFVM